jgi:signal transduction histidine kinase
MKPRSTIVLCAGLLVAAFVLDMLTPQALVAAILLTVPVALSSLVLDRRVTAAFVGAALLADAVAGWYNGLHEGHMWSAIAVANRILAGFSIVLVGWLGSLAQGAARRSGELAARERRTAREHALRRALEAIRSSLNVELVARAIVREAVLTLGVDAARLFVLDATGVAGTTFAFSTADEDVRVLDSRPAPPVLSLVQRALSDGGALAVTDSDPVGRFALEEMRASCAVCVPLVNPRIRFGVLCLTLAGDTRRLQDLMGWAVAFAEQATVAAEQAKLFVQLAEKNLELERATAEQARRGAVIRDLVYALSHDLRTPLTAAAMTMRQALEGVFGPLPEAYRDILRRALASNEDLRRLAETLLLVARYESGEQSAVRHPVDLASVASSVVSELKPMWRAKDVACSLSRSQEDLTVAGDEFELRRAIMNLLANAITWTPAGGHVTVEVTAEGGRVAVRVRDDGYGVPEDVRERLFRRFEPGEGRRDGAGSGLGLYIVSLIATSHGGDVRYEPGIPQGSTFVLSLPRWTGAGRSPSLPVPERPPAVMG